MDRRKKRTSTNQYMLYIDLMEKDNIFATGRVPREVDSNYLSKKWKELSDKLNTCNSGPTLTSEEWRKRLNDWKNTTRCKYRRSVSGEKDIAMTSLELKALELFGKSPNISNETMSINLKSEKEEVDEELEHQRTSESFQKELQAAVEEAIGGDDEEEEEEEEVMGELQEESDDVHTQAISNSVHNSVNSGNNGGAVTVSVGTGANPITTYRTIVENAQYADDDHDVRVEYITQRRHTMGPAAAVATVATGVQTVATTTPTTTVTKLINGDIPLKRLRTHAPEQIIYEVKKAPVASSQHTTRNITIHNSAAPNTILHHMQTQQSELHGNSGIGSSTILNGSTIVTANDSKDIARQLKRLADIKAEKLKFEIARFKFNNPGFHYNYPQL